MSNYKEPKESRMGKRLAEHSRKKREEQRKEKAKLEKTTSGVNQYYEIGAVIALGVIDGLSYYIYRTKKGQVSREVKDISMPHNPSKQPPLTNKFEMD